MVRRRFARIAAALVLAVSSFFGMGIVLPAVAACEPLPTQSQATVKVNIPESGDYRLWLHQSVPNNSSGMLVQVDNMCPSAPAKNESSDFTWIGIDTAGQPLTFKLTAGEHTVTFAGDRSGIKVDRGLFAADRECVPQDLGDNCLVASVVADGQSSTPEAVADISAAAELQRKANGWLIVNIIAGIGIFVTIGIAAWQYSVFIRRVLLPPVAGGSGAPVVPHPVAPHIFRLANARQFLSQHRVFVLVCGVVMALLVAALTLSIVRADNRPRFDLTNAVLSGDAQFIEDSKAVGGKAVVIGKQPASVVNNGQPGGQPSGGGSSGGGSTGGGTTNPGGGGSNPDPNPNPGGGGLLLECPPWPAFPDENCTGWRHTGVTELTECVPDKYIWDSNVSFDSCYFPNGLVVYGSNVTITRSQVHGAISTHWSMNYDFRGLTLVDVEIEEEIDPVSLTAAVAGHNYTCTRCHVHHTLSGIHVGDNAKIVDSYTHDFHYRDGAHGAGVGMGQGHGSHSRITHNNIQCNRLAGQPQICSSALSMYDEVNQQGNTIDDIVVEKNLFNTVGAYCVYAGGPTGTNIHFIDNYWGKKYHAGCAGYGPITAYAPNGAFWSGNKWADGSGDLIPPF